MFKKDHIILQFTGLFDKQEDEIYEMDVMLIGGDKFVVKWSVERNGWILTRLNGNASEEPFSKTIAERAIRLWSYFEAEKKG